jgi:hypothetical protein
MQIQRHSRRRRGLAVLAAVLVAVPAIAASRALADGVLGNPADPSLREYIGRVLHIRHGSSFATAPRYVAGVRTARGLVLLWVARRGDGTQCTGVEAAFGDADIVRVKLAGRTIADNGITCGSRPGPVGPGNAGLTNGQGLGSVHIEYGQLPARVHAVRVTFEDGLQQTATADHGWVIVAFDQGTRRAGHRPLLEQALDAGGEPIATQRLNSWDYGGTELPPPPLDGPGSQLLATVQTPSGPAQLRLSAPGRGWQRRQCWGLILDRRSTRILCRYPASLDPATPPESNNNVFLYGPRLPGVVIAIATRIDAAWLVAADHSVRPGVFVRFTLARARQVVIVAPTGSGRRALTGIVTSRDNRIVGALLVASRWKGVPGAATAPCFLAVPSAGAPPATPACNALMATARRAGGSGLR